MARAIALIRTRSAQFEGLRMLVVYGCAAALIAAGHSLPLITR